MQQIHRLLIQHYFPYHQRIDELIDSRPVQIAFDCHSMVPVGLLEQADAGKNRPLICISNNGDRCGRAKKNSIATCPVEWLTGLAGCFREEFSSRNDVAINNPFPGGFISNAHYWRKGIPWIQIEINRSLYETAGAPAPAGLGIELHVKELRDRIWKVLTRFWDSVG
jgi:formiminoglutamase